MTLLDHCRPPANVDIRWASFHSGWAYEMARSLNRFLVGRGYRAVPSCQIGTQLQVDVGTLEPRDSDAGRNGGGTATAVQTYAPPATSLAMEVHFPDDIELQIFDTEFGSRLVGAVELVSPANKDRPETRRGFAGKCASYLHRGIGLVILDVVTIRQHNLHDELIQLLDQPESLRYPTESPLYATAYRPSGRGGRGRVEIWTFDLTVGQPLPTVPLPLRDGPTVPLDLQATYLETRQSLGL